MNNTSTVNDDPHWLEVLWNASDRGNITDNWFAVPPRSFVGKLPANQLDYLLGNAVAYNYLARPEWLLAHGAKVTSTHAYSP